MEVYMPIEKPSSLLIILRKATGSHRKPQVQ